MGEEGEILGESTLICSFYSFQPIVVSIHAVSPKKIVLLVAEGALRKDPKVKEDIELVKKTFSQAAEVKVVELDGSDILSIAKKTIELLEADDSEKVVNISGGWKLLSQGVLYGCYARPDRVSRIICNNLDKENELVDLPKFTFEMSNGKRSVLEAVEAFSAKKEGKVEVADIAKKAGKSEVMVYQHLDDLKKLNYVDNENRITEAGRIALLWRGERK